MKGATRFAVIAGSAVLLSAGCRTSESGSGPRATPSASSAAGAVPLAPRARELLSAEVRRDSKAVPAADLASRDPALRRAAARALARIGDAQAAELLSKALADEDPEVVTWAAYGVGFACRGREPSSVRSLVARAASLAAAGEPQPAATRGRLFSPVEAIADALGRCGTPDAERSLRSWLEGPKVRAEAAALALGRLAAKSGRLEDTSLVALLDAASRPEEPLGAALYPFTRLPGLGEPVRARLFQIAKDALAKNSAARSFAVRALGQAGPAAAIELKAVLANPGRSSHERADAARELARLAEPGQEALRSALPTLTEELLGANGKLLEARYGVLLRALQSLEPPVRDVRETLERLADLPLGDADSAELRRRKVALRCRAASLLAGRATLSERLRACDPDPNGRAGAMAVIEALDRGKLEGARARRLQALARSSDPIVRSAAIGLLGRHPELDGAFELLATALGDPAPGVIIAAAKVLALYPDRAEQRARGEPEPEGEKSPELARTARRPHAKVIHALTRALEGAQSLPNVELRAALMDAAAALQLLGVKPVLERNCTSANAGLRAHAEAALRVLGDRERRCTDFVPTAAPPFELALASAAKVRLTTALGELTLELSPELAPIAVSRFVELVKAGFYDGLPIHRVVPGFVVQFGDPKGDGYGGSGKPLLPCETSPVAFFRGDVGVALSGRDTGDSQLFVTLGDYPHLSGEYARVGQAEGPWDRLTEGDVIQKATVVE